MKERECPYVICFLSELVGTVIMMYVGCMGTYNLFALGPTVPAFTFGCAIIAAIQIFSHFTPVHVNPAVTLGIVILGRMHWKKALIYAVAQYCGAFLGFYLLKAVMPNHPNLCLLHLEQETKSGGGFLLEATVTLLLLMVVAGSTDEENHHLLDSISVRLGILVTALVFALAPYTGACLNPARSMPPCIYYKNWKNHWMYHLSPYTGASVGAVVYRFVFDNHRRLSLFNYFRRRESHGA